MSSLQSTEHEKLGSEISREVETIIPYFSPHQTSKPGLHINRKDRKHMLANTLFKLSMYALVST